MQTQYSIQSNVPTPEHLKIKLRPGRPPKYPFERLTIGQSFFVPLKDLESSSKTNTPQQRFSSSLTYYRYNTYKDFKSHKRTEKGIEGIRVWRIK